MGIRRLLFYTCWVLLHPRCLGHTHGRNDYMGNSDRRMVKEISIEAIKEAQLKQRQIHDIIRDHSFTLAFDVGLLMGNIREKYRLMLETYRELRDKRSKRSVFFPPGVDHSFFPLYYVFGMEELHTLELDIDKLVHVLISMDHEELNPDPRYIGQDQRTRRRYLRSGDMKIIGRMADEQEYKSRVREAHLMRRLGMPGGLHTTLKRFQNQWPIDKNWELGAYGDMGLYA